MSVFDVTTSICKMLGVDPADALFVRLTLRIDAPPLVEVERFVLDPVIGADRYELAPIGTLAQRHDLLALAHQYASECGDCAGTRIVAVPNDDGGFDADEPCTACADVWEVIDRAEGRQ